MPKVDEEKVQLIRDLMERAIEQLERDLDEWYFLGIIPERWKHEQGQETNPHYPQL